MAPTKTSKWMTTAAVHKSFGIPKRTIIAAINRGDLPAQKLPGLTGAFLIAPADLERWIDRRSVKAAS